MADTLRNDESGDYITVYYVCMKYSTNLEKNIKIDLKKKCV